MVVGVAAKFAQHASPPSALAWGAHVLVAAADGRVCFYGAEGGLERTFDLSAAATGGAHWDWTCAAIAPSGEAAAVGCFGGFSLFSLGGAGGGEGGREWALAATREVAGFYSTTALVWKPDGAKLAVGGFTGASDIYDVCLRRTRYKGKFEFTYVSQSTVIVKRLSNGTRIVLSSSFGYRIEGIHIHSDRYLTARTPATLLMGDLDSCRLSEIPWHQGGEASGGGGRGRGGAAAPQPAATEKFLFNIWPTVCIVARSGELTLVEYGKTEPLGSVRSEHVVPRTLSVRIVEEGASYTGTGAGAGAPPPSPGLQRKLLAFLLDANTLRVVDLAPPNSMPGTLATLATCAVPDARITWLEMSGRGGLVLFRDGKKRLHLLDVASGTRSTLLPFCSFARWVPHSDVAVAQRRGQLCVWYNIRSPEKVSVYDIRGDVEGVVREGGTTEVIVDEGLTTAAYALDDSLISYGAAMDARAFPSAASILESLTATRQNSPEVEGMWAHLRKSAEAVGDLATASRASVALGDAARARFLRRAQKSANKAPGGARSAEGSATMAAALAQLTGDLSAAEGLLLSAGNVGAAISLYAEVGRGEDAVALAEAHGRMSEAEALRRAHLAHLLNTEQEDRAGGAREAAGDAQGAIELYLRAGRPGRALAVAISSAAVTRTLPRELLERTISALAASGLFDKAGALLERLGEGGRALDAYVKGAAWRHAVDLARKSFPGKVVELERSWGEWLAGSGAVEAAINHFIEAGAHAAAIDAALQARQFAKAGTLIEDTMGSAPDAARPLWRRLAAAYASRGSLEDAERAHLRAGDGRAAVEMLLAAGRFDAAGRCARGALSEADMVSVYHGAASRAEAAGNLRTAERLYTAVHSFDAAAAMYKRCRDWDAMLRMVSAGAGGGRGEAVREAHKAVARAVLQEGGGSPDAAREAEKHLCAAGDWDGAVAMYKGSGAWEEALRVARQHGGASAAHAVAFEQARALGGEAGVKLLQRLGMLEVCADLATDAGLWDWALDMCEKHAREKVPGVLLKRALAREDAGEYGGAEVDFLAAGKPREAIEMYIHLADWRAAGRLADAHDSEAVGLVLCAEAGAAVKSGDLARAERLYVQARKPEAAVEAYLAGGTAFHPDALRLAKTFVPARVPEVTDRIRRAAAAGGPLEGGSARRGGGVASPPPQAGAAGGMSSPGGRRAGAAAAAAASASTPGGGKGGAQRGGGADPIATAKMWESSRDWGAAIDAYLSLLSPTPVNDEAMCEAAWLRAVSLCSSWDRGRWVEVTEEVAHRLAENRRWDAAGELFRDLGQPDRASDCFVRAGAWAKAKEAARGGPPALLAAVEAAHKKSIVAAGNADAMAAVGATEAALSAYSASGQWEKLFETASKAGASTLAKYLYPRMAELLAEEGGGASGGGASGAQGLQVLALLERYGAPPEPSVLPLYRRLVAAIFAPDKAPSPTPAALLSLRDVLYKLVGALRKSGGAATKAALPGYERLLLAVHYASVRCKLKELGLGSLAAQASASLLRFTDLVPADLAYCEAGIGAREAGDAGGALVLLNRYIDICEAMEEGARDAGGLRNGELAASGFLPPHEFPLPSRPRVTSSQREEVHTWVLTKGMDKVAQALPTKPCTNCGAQKPTVALACVSCNHAMPACIVTGGPVQPSQETSCAGCGSKAAGPAWAALCERTKACCWCGAAVTR